MINNNFAWVAAFPSKEPYKASLTLWHIHLIIHCFNINSNCNLLFPEPQQYPQPFGLPNQVLTAMPCWLMLDGILHSGQIPQVSSQVCLGGRPHDEVSSSIFQSPQKMLILLHGPSRSIHLWTSCYIVWVADCFMSSPQAGKSLLCMWMIVCSIYLIFSKWYLDLIMFKNLYDF